MKRTQTRRSNHTPNNRQKRCRNKWRMKDERRKRMKKYRKARRYLSGVLTREGTTFSMENSLSGGNHDNDI